MTDINKLIEEEAHNYHSELARAEIDNFQYEGDVTTDEAESCVRTAEIEGFKAGANFILHQNRWRKFSTDELPHIGEQIVCKSSSGRYHLSNPISHDGIHWLAENFIEWKPV